MLILVDALGISCESPGVDIGNMIWVSGRLHSSSSILFSPTRSSGHVLPARTGVCEVAGSLGCWGGVSAKGISIGLVGTIV